MDDNKDEIITASLGREISLFRAVLNCTQQEFADRLMLNRGTVVKMEKATGFADISIDIAFRLFYYTQKIAEHPYKEAYVVDYAKRLHNRLDCELTTYLENDTSLYQN